jgi:hypothetical protein
MMTLGEHIELSKYYSSERELIRYFERIGPAKSVLLKRNIEESYPIQYRKIDYENLPFNANIRVFDLVLGQFIMIEQIFTGKNPMPQNIADFTILSLILRPKNHTEFDNTNEEEESLNRQNILNLDLWDAMSILKDFVDNRNKTLFEDFKGVFYDPDADKEEEEDEEGMDEEFRKANDFEYKFKEQWYWYNIVRRLAGENVLMYDKIYMLKMETVLPELSFLIQKAKLDRAAEFRAKVANKL